MNKKECIICGGGHHYYNCKNDISNIQDDGSVILTNDDIDIIIGLVVEKIKINDDIKYKMLHSKILDMLLQE